MPETRLLIFGGTFDPPHLAHTTLPPLAADALGCTRILYIPAATNPLKLDTPPTASYDPPRRCAMTDAQSTRPHPVRMLVAGVGLVTVLVYTVARLVAPDWPHSGTLVMAGVIALAASRSWGYRKTTTTTLPDKDGKTVFKAPE